MKAIVVTGATSMLGIATIKAALHDGVNKIYAVVRPDSSNINRLPKSKKIVVISSKLEDYHLLTDLIQEECEAFYHFAWEASRKDSKDRYFDVEVSYRNIGYALQAYEAARKLHCKNFVGAGSQSEYGNLRNEIQRPDDIASPVTALGIAKDTIRRLLFIKSRESGPNVQWIRIFSVYGIYDRKNTLISMLLDKMFKQEDVELTKCTQIWDYLFESDAGEAIYLAGKEGTESNVFCLGSGICKPLKEYVEEIRNITKTTSQIYYGKIPMGANYVYAMKADISKIQSKTSWKGPRTMFKEGISLIINSLKRGGANNCFASLPYYFNSGKEAILC